MRYEQITEERRDDVVVLTLHRPERLNAWTPRMTAEAGEALALGLADELVPHDALLEAALARARSYGENPPSARRATKRLLTANATDPDTTAVQRREIAALVEADASPEHAEAVTAFLEARRTR